MCCFHSNHTVSVVFFSICFRVSSSARHSLPPRPRWIPRSLISGEWSVNMKLIALWCYAHRAREKRFGSWLFIDIFSLFFFGWFLIGCNFYSTFPLFFVGGATWLQCRLFFNFQFSVCFLCLLNLPDLLHSFVVFRESVHLICLTKRSSLFMVCWWSRLKRKIWEMVSVEDNWKLRTQRWKNKHFLFAFVTMERKLRKTIWVCLLYCA